MQKRFRSFTNYSSEGTCVLYWMSRDQRTRDNWALLLAQQKAIEYHQPLAIVFHLEKKFFHTQSWHQDFMIEGLQKIEQYLVPFCIPFFFSEGDFLHDFLPLIKTLSPSLVVTDFDPLHIKQKWNLILQETLHIPLIEVDTHNIVPCWLTSNHQEFSARTFRPKIHRLLPEFLTDIPSLLHHPHPWKGISPSHRWPHTHSLPPLFPQPGENAAWQAFLSFLEKGIHRYATEKNNPLAKATSHLSAYFHFGQLSPQRVAYEIINNPTIENDNKQVFLEELIVRRELSDNFVFYQPKYESWEAVPSWAKISLAKHRDDPRPILYSLETLENARTHDPLWNACQKAMKITGYLHGYLRMYWAKQLLIWSPSPEEALKRAIHLNDQYFLDGRDPNGYTGILWSIGGLHDRPFSDRPIIGHIRPMTYQGCERKFSVQKYIKWVENISSL